MYLMQHNTLLCLHILHSKLNHHTLNMSEILTILQGSCKNAYMLILWENIISILASKICVDASLSLGTCLTVCFPKSVPYFCYFALILTAKVKESDSNERESTTRSKMHHHWASCWCLFPIHTVLTLRRWLIQCLRRTSGWVQTAVCRKAFPHPVCINSVMSLSLVVSH